MLFPARMSSRWTSGEGSGKCGIWRSRRSAPASTSLRARYGLAAQSAAAAKRGYEDRTFPFAAERSEPPSRQPVLARIRVPSPAALLCGQGRSQVRLGRLGAGGACPFPWRVLRPALPAFPQVRR